MRTEPSTRLRHWWIAACLLLAMLAGCRTLEPAPAPTLRVMSFNVLVARDIEGPARWSGRRDALVQVIADADPDLLGTQELLREQADFITARLPQYAWFGHGRRGDGAADDEHMGVFYHRERMRLLDSGHFWLSDTPDVPGSITWGTRYPRMASWGLFERIADGKRLYLLNTHMPYRDEDATAPGVDRGAGRRLGARATPFRAGGHRPLVRRQGRTPPGLGALARTAATHGPPPGRRGGRRAAVGPLPGAGRVRLRRRIAWRRGGMRHHPVATGRLGPVQRGIGRAHPGI